MTRGAEGKIWWYKKHMYFIETEYMYEAEMRIATQLKKKVGLPG